MSAVDEAQMLALGARLAAALTPGLVVYLVGGLGMGKTTLARGVVQALGHGGAVKSPTYTLVEPYEIAGQTVYHFDLYRLADPEELEFMGIRDYFTESSLALIEWPERGEGFLPPADLVVRIEREGQGRCLLVEANSARGRHCLQGLTDVAAMIGESGV
ncbi:MAG: tRNA (adenosine(37)-N6)-threonylcarbamoyltransferase complex ATPase subunit type 1 TsaE [Gammaproteobacteria bacterium]|nr:tRNA (adenosine(37)-N6)-threonylcarbamoyltransferase complex ATPase subunit type 1 TsaE [Gammaproteobacteria bacterium]